jgi:hypothetical protein
VSQALILLFYVVLSAPGLFIWWFLHHAIEPSLIWSIPAPRKPVPYTEDLGARPDTDWRGLT